MEEETQGLVLLDVASIQFVRVNPVLLKGLLEQRSLPGMLISVDRPHQCMVHLLKMHDIPLDKAVFVDVIGRPRGARRK